MAKQFNTAFINENFHNWKKATERFRRHEASECHREAVPYSQLFLRQIFFL